MSLKFLNGKNKFETTLRNTKNIENFCLSINKVLFLKLYLIITLHNKSYFLITKNQYL